MLFFWGRNFMTLQSPLIENDELLCKIESNINVFSKSLLTVTNYNTLLKGFKTFCYGTMTEKLACASTIPIKPAWSMANHPIAVVCDIVWLTISPSVVLYINVTFPVQTNPGTWTKSIRNNKSHYNKYLERQDLIESTHCVQKWIQVSTLYHFFNFHDRFSVKTNKTKVNISHDYVHIHHDTGIKIKKIFYTIIYRFCRMQFPWLWPQKILTKIISWS